MPKRNLYLLSIFSGILLALGWPHHGFAPLLFFGFVPLLLVEYEVQMNSGAYKKINLFSLAFTTFFTWNLITTYWIYYASFGGAVMAIIANSFLMTMVFVAYQRVKKRIGYKWGGMVFIVFWLTFEFIHYHWDLSWTWLTLGNGFANYPKWIQWYEYTGVFGGSLWILSANILIFKLVKEFLYQGKRIPGNKTILFLLSNLIVLPLIISLTIYTTYREESNPVNVIVVQPNIDPYNEKFSGSYPDQLFKMLKLAGEKVDSTTDYLVFPETALTEDIWENTISSAYSIARLKQYIKDFPKLKIILGAATYKNYGKEDEELTETARKFKDSDSYYDAFNTAIQIDSSDYIQIYHKSKLVPGVEKMPYPMLLRPLENFAIDLGGTAGSLGMQESPSVFTSPDQKIKIAPVICYESVYGEFVTEYIKKGAQLIFIITNDGWWGDSPGYKQHLSYASLRAIETRRSIARSANTGISCFINQRGDLQFLTNWWTDDVISSTINANNKETFYVKTGDYIGQLASIISLVILCIYLIVRFKSTPTPTFMK